jgi:hypothetical protein
LDLEYIFLPGASGIWGFKTPNYCCDVLSRHHSINRAFKEHTPTRYWQKAELIGHVSIASDRTNGRQKYMLPMGISAIDLKSVVLTLSRLGSRLVRILESSVHKSAYSGPINMIPSAKWV